MQCCQDRGLNQKTRFYFLFKNVPQKACLSGRLRKFLGTLKFLFAFVPTILLLKAWFMDQHVSITLEQWSKCRISGLAPDLPHLNLHFYKLPGWYVSTFQFENMWSLRPNMWLAWVNKWLTCWMKHGNSFVIRKFSWHISQWSLGKQSQ